MKCPKCNHQIEDKIIARHFAALGGRGNRGKKKGPRRKIEPASLTVKK